MYMIPKYTKVKMYFKTGKIKESEISIGLWRQKFDFFVPVLKHWEFLI